MTCSRQIKQGTRQHKSNVCLADIEQLNIIITKIINLMACLILIYVEYKHAMESFLFSLLDQSFHPFHFLGTQFKANTFLPNIAKLYLMNS